jgi:hypothetical protein
MYGEGLGLAPRAQDAIELRLYGAEQTRQGSQSPNHDNPKKKSD